MVTQIEGQDREPGKRSDKTLADMQAQDLMSDNPAVIAPSTTLGAALEIVAKLHVRHLAVVDKGHLVGVLSERDLGDMPHDKAGRAAAQAQPVIRYLNRAPISVVVSTDINEIIDVLVSNRISAVPVVSEANELQGTVSYVDILRALRRSLE